MMNDEYRMKDLILMLINIGFISELRDAAQFNIRHSSFEIRLCQPLEPTGPQKQVASPLHQIRAAQAT